MRFEILSRHVDFFSVSLLLIHLAGPLTSASFAGSLEKGDLIDRALVM